MAVVEWYSGDTNPLTITVTEGGVAVGSLAGATIKAAFVTRIDASETPALSLTTDDFTIADNVATAYPDTSGLLGRYIVEIEVTDASGNVMSEQLPVKILEDQL